MVDVFMLSVSVVVGLAVSSSPTNPQQLNPDQVNPPAGLPPVVEVKQLSGVTASGELTGLSSDKVVITSQSETKTYSRKSLLALEHSEPEDTLLLFGTEQPALTIRLRGGSELTVTDYQAADGRASIQLKHGATIVCSTKSVEYVRFKSPDHQIEDQWLAVFDGERSGDSIVVRKSAQVVGEDGVERVAVALNRVEGVVQRVEPSFVAFEYDGTQVNVPRDRVEGVVYFQARPGKLPGPIARVFDRTGSVWNVRSVELSQGELELISVSGVRASIPLEELARIDYSIGNLVYLSDLQPESSEYRPHFSSQSTPLAVSGWFRPRSERRFLSLGGKSYEHGVSLHSRTEISYRFRGDFQRFLATVGIDDRSRHKGSVRLKIDSNQGTLFDQEVSSEQEPFELDLDVAGIRRLKILVDFGADGTDRGDQLNLCNARLTK